MDKLQKMLADLGLNETLQPTQMNWSSISEAASTLWSEASRQLRSEAQKKRSAEEAGGLYMNKPEEAYAVSDASIFRRYETLVQKHMVDSRRPRERDVDSQGREITWYLENTNNKR